MRIFLLSLFLVSQAFAINILGQWKLKGEHPINFNAIIAYGMNVEFTDSGEFFISKSTSITHTKHFYKLEGNELTVFLQSASTVQNILLKYSSATQTFKLEKIDNNCYKATDMGKVTNSFKMCKK